MTDPNIRSNVVMDRSGTFRNNAPGRTAAHEFGHMAGLDDHYIEKTGLPKKGWEGNLMASSRHGLPDQRNINDILKGRSTICGCK